MRDDLGQRLQHWWDEVLEGLGALVGIPTVSARGERLEEGARKVAELARRFGLEAEVVPFQDAAPFVLAWHSSGAKETLLFYNHYDVQPEDPLDLWDSPPFELSRREGKLYGRGVSDDKGHILARLAAVRLALEALGGTLPVNVVLLVEGEEEIGSPHVEVFLKEHQDRLRASGCIWESGGVNAFDQPELYMGMKGVIALELRARGPVRDLHSSLGPLAPNPLWRLVAFLNSLKDEREHIRIPGFYDDVRPPTEEDIEALKRVPDETETWKREWGVDRFLTGVEGWEALRRLLFEPYININGIHGGYGGPGSKTVLPAQAVAKLDIRLVPDQEPQDIVEKLIRYRDALGFSDIEVRLSGGAEGPARTPLNDPFVKRVAQSAARTYGTEPVLLPIVPGSGPMAAFRNILGVPIVGCGVGYPESRIHSPNENIRERDLERGILHIADLLVHWEEDRP